MDIKLVVVGGKAQATEFALQLPAVVGRSRTASLPLNHPLVSRQHCEIFEKNGRLMVRDLGSLNGTYVGDVRIADDVPLAPGGLLTIGSVTFRAMYESTGANGDEDGPDFAPLADSGEISQTIQASDMAVLADQPGADTEDGPPSDTRDGGFQMDWLAEEQAEEEPAAPATESAPATGAASPAVEDLGDEDLEVVDHRTPQPDEAAEAIEDVERGESTPEEEEVAETARAIDNGDRDVSVPDAPASAGESDDDLDDFFRSLSQP